MTWPTKSRVHELAERLRQEDPYGGRAEYGGRGPAAAIRVANRPAGFGRADGWLGVDTAPLFAAAFATRQLGRVFGGAGGVGGGRHQHGFAAALGDDGSLTGRGHPWARGLVCGVMTTLGGVGHTLPYLIQNFHVATTVAVAVVALELAVISWVRHRYMDTPFMSAAFQVVVGGVLVFLTGILIGSS